MMDHSGIQERLDDFVDGEIPAGEEEAAIRRHIAACTECRREVEAVSALRAQARALPREIAPPRDLWPEIAARIGARPDQASGGVSSEAPLRVSGLRMQPPLRRPWRRRVGLVGGVLVLVALSSAVTALWLGRAGAPTLAVEPTPRVEPDAARPAALAAFRPTEREYLRTVEELEMVLNARREQLAPETLATVEESLRIIDGAIQEARAALAADPANADLPLMLSGTYRKKVQLLQDAIQLSKT